jgi:biotin carboxyl carrier protein
VRVDDARGAKRSVSVDGTHVTVHAALGGGPGALSERGPSLGEAEGWVDAFGVAAAVGDNTHAPPRADRRGGSGRVTSSMHGAVVRLAVQPGQTVKRGDLLMAIEAMKMEHRIEAAIDGTVAEVGVAQGQQVAPGRLLVSIEPAPQAGAPAAQ